MPPRRDDLGAVFAPILSLAAPSSAQSQPPCLPTPTVTTGWSVSPSTVDALQKRSLAHPARLVNLFVPAVAGSRPEALVAGAVIQGSGTVPLLVRAIGPGLRPFGVTNALRDSALEVFRSSASAAKTSAFTGDATVASAYVRAFPLMPAADAAAGDAALLGQAAVGPLTAQCSFPRDGVRDDTRLELV
jgi:hypothetical protein